MVKVLNLFECLIWKRLEVGRPESEDGRPEPEVDSANEKLLFIIILFKKIIRYLIN